MDGGSNTSSGTEGGEVAAVAAELGRRGALCVRSVLSAATAAAAARQVDADLVARLDALASGDSSQGEYFGDVTARVHRYDLRQRLRGAVLAAVLEAMRSVAPLVAAVLASDTALLCELSCLISDPGAPRQPLHSDTGLSLAGVGETGDSCIGGGLLTVFVALQDVEADMGGTIVLLETNRSSHAHSTLGADEDGHGMLADVDRWPQLSFQGSAGDAMLMDSRVLHCGGANTSLQRRRLLYMTFKLPDCNPAGSTYSLLDEYRDCLRLRSWQDWKSYADKDGEGQGGEEGEG
jgi:ectoine hydroxylase-related dioxygenase (phytanoyl-CoA dioxygenase family)|eukprot:COSAG01_NODE_16697_length_1213_cov_49.252244_1_plen_292_part_00